MADLTVINPFDFFVEESAEFYGFSYEPQLASDLEPYSEAIHRDGTSARQVDRRCRSWHQERQRNHRHRRLPRGDQPAAISQDIEYSVRMEPGVQSPDETLTRAIGSCRDTGWLLVEALRRLGLAARFVSGYLVQLTADKAALDGADGPAADFTDLHAWAEVYVPGAGWIGLDPTSGLFAGEGHIPLACTPHPASAAPVTGAIGPANTTFSFSNVVQRIREDPRVTLPYTPEQWSAIDQLGMTVDKQLDAGDVRLTMGGEPTFVSIDDMEGAEWNISADSPAKRKLAHELSERLRDRFGAGGLLQHGQGKWYPGEPLPRWRIDIVWRNDGQPLWARPDLLAVPAVTGTATIADAQAFATAVADKFGLAPDAAVAAFEDPIDLAWRESRLPDGDPPEAEATSDDAATPDARAALIERLSGAAEPTGYLLPLHRGHHEGRPRWCTTNWELRRGQLFLIPGDSPIGLRMPLDSLMWSPFPDTYERSEFEPRDELPNQVSSPPNRQFWWSAIWLLRRRSGSRFATETSRCFCRRSIQLTTRWSCSTCLKRLRPS